MATAAADSINNSPRSPAADSVAGAAVSSPQSLRPWAKVVRGSSPEQTTSPEQISLPEKDDSNALPESSDNTIGNVGQPKKLAWNKPVNGVVVEPVSVMGGSDSWPALSESTKPGPKSSTDKPVPDGSLSDSQGPVISQLPQKQGNTNANANSNANATTPARQRSMKHRGSGGGSGPGGGPVIRGGGPPPSPPPLPPPFPVMPYGNLVSPVLEPPVRGSRPLGGFQGDHSPHRNHGGRKGNFGGRPRGDGSYHGGRRDQDRRDVHHLAPPQFIPPPPPPAAGFIPPQPPGSGPFLPPPPVRPFPGPMGFDMPQFFYVPPLSPEFRGVPMINQGPPPPPLYFPLVDPNTPPSLVQQIEYYFSDANLVKDDFLRSKMDEEGWVPIELIANFPRVKRWTDTVQFTDSVQFISHCLRVSTLVEVQDEKKVRRRDDWRKWTHTSGRLAADSGSSAPAASTDGILATSLQNVSLNESATTSSSAPEATDAQVEVAPGVLLDESTNQSKLFQEEGTTEVISSSQA